MNYWLLIGGSRHGTLVEVSFNSRGMLQLPDGSRYRSVEWWSWGAMRRLGVSDTAIVSAEEINRLIREKLV